MSKGILNNRDKMIWDNTHKPDISDVVSEINGEMDDLLDAHDDKVVDIVGDNMNDLLDAHDDKVVSIVGDNMSTLLTGAASSVQLIAGDKSGIGTTEGVKVGTWDATHDIYAIRYTGTLPAIASGTYAEVTINSIANAGIVDLKGKLDGEGLSRFFNGLYTDGYTGITVTSTFTGMVLRYGTIYAENTVDVIVYYLVSTETPTP